MTIWHYCDECSRGFRTQRFWRLVEHKARKHPKGKRVK